MAWVDVVVEIRKRSNPPERLESGRRLRWTEKGGDKDRGGERYRTFPDWKEESQVWLMPARQWNVSREFRAFR